ncbi:glycosyltransferase family 9 protein [Neorhodopirellula pilleata]|uniref:Lipopolysaccharide heptosyltransferase 1 n=1 Tax=Neorhodopirellula pilleata TaxID=2714738 RepID=A0A5C5ZX95_9BACT|nr:glycosyltransferase family 9 protein [Neorhodopirellula pilleata]TWT91598.1 Lipopolysaccharide heptosyltransferase 1 [Neorhodopirellula pilleata]
MSDAIPPIDSLSHSPRILIAGAGDVSDVVHSLPVACCLRDHYPDAHLGWLIGPEVAALVRGHRAIDEVLEVPPGWYRSPSLVRETRKALRQSKFDITIDCQGDLVSALACYLSGARHRIGFTAGHAWDAFAWLNNERVVPVFDHLVDRRLELLTPLRIHHPRVRWDLPIGRQDQLWANQCRSQIRSARLAILNPGADCPSKRWEADRFSATARYLADRYGYRSLAVWTTFEDRLMAEQIVERSEGTVTLAPDTTLMMAAALFQTADLLISSDAGPLHLAVAVGTPAIGLYGPSRPSDRGPYHQVSLRRQTESSSHGFWRSVDNYAMTAIGVEHVCEAIDELHASNQIGFSRAA